MRVPCQGVSVDAKSTAASACLVGKGVQLQTLTAYRSNALQRVKMRNKMKIIVILPSPIITFTEKLSKDAISLVCRQNP